jgi:UDPglucose 6-dehydrogenase
MYDVLNNTDALLIVTEWPEFRVPDFEDIAKRLTSKVIFDGRNVFDSTDMKNLGFEYYCIGIKTK